MCFSLFAFLFVALQADAAVPDDSPDRLELWYTQPADEWSDALPIGNGRLGAMVHGGIAEEHLQLNEDTLWSGGPQSYDNPEAYGHLADVRALLDQGEYAKAEDLAQKMMGQPIYQAAYQPLGDLYLRFPHDKNPDAEQAVDYRRELDLRTAVSTVSYRIGDAHFTRKTFASHPDQVIAMQLECDQPGRLTFDVILTSPHPSQALAIAGNTLSMTGQVASRGKSRERGSRALIGPWDGDGMQFAAQVHVETKGGTIVARGDKLAIQDADSVTLYYSAATNFVSSQDLSGAPLQVAGKHLAEIQGETFDRLHQTHVDDYSSLFDRVAFELGAKETDSLPTDERIRRAQAGKVDPVLIEQVFQYGRYLMIAGSRPGTQPLNLQGIWNNDLDPRWGSKYTININIEMNYWVAEVCNLSECHEPLLRLVSELEAPGRKTAKVHYNANGWMTHHNTDLWRGTAPVDGAQWGMWPMGGAWLCQHLWEHYLYTGDTEHLEKSYPLMKAAAEFFLDTLVEDVDGFLITSPSLSPEHSHGGGTQDGLSVGRSGISLCAGPTIDRQILRDLFANCIAASERLEMDEDFRAKVIEARSRLAPMKIGRHGQLQEWLVDWDNPKDQHSHVSHMYGLFPSSQINRDDTPELFEAARTSMLHRGFSGGWPGAWRIALWARLGDGDRALTALNGHVIPRFANNFFNGGEGFQIDANFGATAGIAEMLMQSHNDEIHLLPALPEAWPGGAVKGLKARGGYEVDLSWEDGKLIQATVRQQSKNAAGGSVAKVRYQTETRQATLATGDSFTWEGN